MKTRLFKGKEVRDDVSESESATILETNGTGNDTFDKGGAEAAAKKVAADKAAAAETEAKKAAADKVAAGKAAVVEAEAKRRQ